MGSDHLGTPKVVTDNTGTIVRQVEYNSWGVKISDTNPSFELPVGFAGGIPDDVTGLVRFGWRDYEPASGRWAAKDPIFFNGGLNLFQYAANDPVNLKDPTGLDADNPVTMCHVNRHTNRGENAIAGVIVVSPGILAVAPYAVGIATVVPAWSYQYIPAVSSLAYGATVNPGRIGALWNNPTTQAIIGSGGNTYGQGTIIGP